MRCVGKWCAAVELQWGGGGPWLSEEHARYPPPCTQVVPPGQATVPHPSVLCLPNTPLPDPCCPQQPIAHPHALSACSPPAPPPSSPLLPLAAQDCPHARAPPPSLHLEVLLPADLLHLRPLLLNIPPRERRPGLWPPKAMHAMHARVVHAVARPCALHAGRKARGRAGGEIMAGRVGCGGVPLAQPHCLHPHGPALLRGWQGWEQGRRCEELVIWLSACMCV